MANPSQQAPFPATDATAPLTPEPAANSPFFQQAHAHWQQRWQALIEQCGDCFIRY